MQSSPVGAAEYLSPFAKLLTPSNLRDGAMASNPDISLVLSIS
jgi:hypothetical protein